MLVIRGANNMNPQCSVIQDGHSLRFRPEFVGFLNPDVWTKCIRSRHRIVGRGTANLAQMRRIMKLHENGHSYLKWNK